MSDLNTQSVLEQLVDISRRAGLKILEWYGGDMGITLKSDDSPLTKADLASHDLITAELSDRWPDIPDFVRRIYRHPMGNPAKLATILAG